MSKIKMIATDIDGTILKHNFQFNPEVKECIKKLTCDGIHVVLVTGRMYTTITPIANQLGLETPIIAYQGGLVRHGQETLYERTLDEIRAREILDWARKNDVHINLYMDDKLYVEKEDETIKRYTDERNAEFYVQPFENLILDKINKMLIIKFDDENKIDMWKSYLENKYEDVHFVKSMPYFCEVCNPEATKYHAVTFLKEHWGLEQDEILCIGDQNNDIDLLRAGGIKVAMGNATDELKATADYVTDTVNNNGFVKAVERFVYDQVRL